MKNQKTGLYILIFIVLISRIPFLNAGYGTDPDAWRLANVSRNISVNNEYRHMSRYPGHPVQELFCSLIWKGGPFVLNGVTAALSTLAVLFFALILKKFMIKEYLLIAYTFAFIPVIFINSSNSMDYMWALSFIIISIYFILKNKIIMSGIFMGLAIGSRITSGAMLIPLCYYLFNKSEAKLKIQLIKLILISLVVSGITYIPVIMRFGFGFFKFEMYEYPPVIFILKNISIEVWGSLGMIGLIIGIFFIFFDYKKNKIKWRGDDKIYIIFSLIVFMIYIIAFFRAPLKPGYLIPIVPFVLIILYYCLNTKKFRFVCYTIISSSFIFGVYSLSPKNTLIASFPFNVNVNNRTITFDLFNGPLSLDVSKRNEDVFNINKIIQHSRQIHENVVVEAGDMLPLIETTLQSDKYGPVEYCYLFNENDLNLYIRNGYKLYYLPDVNKSNILVNGIDPADFGAELFLSY